MESMVLRIRGMNKLVTIVLVIFNGKNLDGWEVFGT